MRETFTFNLDTIDHAIVEALRVALEDVMPDIMSDHNLVERNGYGQFRWNPIIAQLRETCHLIGWIDFGICSRGAWKTPVLFHPTTSFLFTFMTEDTFSRVQRRRDKGTHYLCGAASFNQELEPKYEQLEIDIPTVDSDFEPWIAKSQAQLAAAVQAEVGDVSGHILVLFRAETDRLSSVRAVRLTHNLEVSTQEEDWSKYIRMPFCGNKKITMQSSVAEDEEDLVALL